MSIRHTIINCSILLLLASCGQQEDLAPNADAETKATGRIVLTLGSDDIYAEVETRATATLADISGYTFTISGTTEMGETVNSQSVSLTRVGATNSFSGIVEAGTYHLTADNYADASAGLTGKPYYSNSSDDFTVEEASTVSLNIALGKPRNAAVTYMLDTSFSSLYDNPTIIITDGDGNTPTLTSPAATQTDLTNAVYCHVAPTSATQSVYTPYTARTLNYILSATARPSSHATDINAATGTITVTSGCHTIITISADPVTGTLIPTAAGQHIGEFD